ncbi:uncharacterized protein TM35_000241330 [Trypanosoma theileri]|uniref:Uncharacterized protein n=1 Tax=Trypanosoma theileri TaxID=67003 RepID=A0A1X0NR70_9TRYP|nr:uncharacterized protein TM35_000241330 [Trypanosoma theileri]ORC86983.1 hypothetical protein TM35_000241330 [Trypanosoma theileri]
MESSPSSLSYLRAVQQLEKKTEELERVFNEARRLERENSTLARENAALREERDALAQNVARLEAQNREWRDEFGLLEAQVRQQQQHLQEHIEREFTRVQEAALRGREHGAEVIAQQQLLQQEEQEKEEKERKQSALLEAKCRGLRREVAQLRRALAVAGVNSQQQHGHHTTHTRARKREGDVMDEIEARALAGVRGELAAFAAENERLMNALELERDARVAAESGVENLQQLLRRQRDVSEQQLQLAKQELQALNMQNDTLLQDLRYLMGGDAQNNGDANSTSVFLKEMHAKKPRHRQKLTVDRGTITTEVHLSTLQSPEKAAENVADIPVKTTNTTRTTTASVPSTGNMFASLNQTGSYDSNTYIKELLQRVHNLEEKNREQDHIIREKETNERLLEERVALNAEEKQHLRSLLEQAEAFEKTRESSNIVRAVADTELSTVLEAIIDLLRLYVDCAARLRARLFPQNIPIESTPFPLIPCREYSSPHLNAIFTHIGGIRHIATVIDDLGKTKYEQVKEKQHPLEPSATSTREHESGICTSSSHNRQEVVTSTHSSTLLQCTNFLKNRQTTSAIGAWLEARKNNLQEQLSNKKTFRTASPIHEQTLPKQIYQSGETLVEAANGLHKQSFHSQSKAKFTP